MSETTIEQHLGFIRLKALWGVELDEDCPPIEAAHDVIADHVRTQAERITELEILLTTCVTAHCDLRGDVVNKWLQPRLHKSHPEYNVAMGVINAVMGCGARIDELEMQAASLRKMLKWAREFVSPPIDFGYFQGGYEEAVQEFNENCNECRRLLQESEGEIDD